MSDGITGTLMEVTVLPNTIEELVVAIYDQTGKHKVSRQDALDMGDFLERERYERKPQPSSLAGRFGKSRKIKGGEIKIYKVK